LPELSRLPREITLRRLATHTAGLPRWPQARSFALSLHKNPKNPLGTYTSDELLGALAEHVSPPPSDRTVAYSNVGPALLGIVCARAAGCSYEEALESRIAGPLGLRDTSVRVPADRLSRLAPPHVWHGAAAAPWEMPAFLGAGALRSTTDDMIRFLAANLEPGRSLPSLALCHDVQITDPSIGTTGPGADLVREIARAYGYEVDPSEVVRSHPRLRPGRFRVALGWMRTIDDDGHDIHWHSGATSGYCSFAAFDKREGTAVTVLANRGPTIGDTAVEDIGFGALRLLAVAPPEFAAHN
jgi:CubicO group peptidase (beta-lactamase class C family)